MAWVEQTGTKAALIGGLAASACGRARMTRDIDIVLVVDDKDLATLLNKATCHNLEPRLPNAAECAERSRMLLLRHLPSRIDIDVALGLLPFERGLVDKAKPVRFGDVTIPIPPPEDLIVMKALARRPRDFEDIRGMLAANPRIDRDDLRRRVADMAAEMGESDILSDFEHLLPPTERE
jgi:hypothetical protein